MDPTRRHPNVINGREAPVFERAHGRRYGFTARRLAATAGAKAIGASLYELPPGKTAFPRHWHGANEEAMFVLDGEGEVRIGDATVAIGAGDWVSFPTGPEHAHQVSNPGAKPLHFLALSTQVSTEVVGYPDSRKIMCAAMRPGADFLTEKPWVRGIFEEEKQVDYYHRETVD